MAMKRRLLRWLLGVDEPEAPSGEGPEVGRALPAADGAVASSSGPTPAPAPLVEGSSLPSEPKEPPPEERPCVMCGGTNFRWGWLESGLYGTGKGTSAEQSKFVKHKTRFGDFVGLRARLCIGCLHVAIFARQDEDEEPAQP